MDFLTQCISTAAAHGQSSRPLLIRLRLLFVVVVAVFLMERTHTHTSEQCLLCGKEPRVTSVNETVLLQHVTQLPGVDLAC